MSKHIKHTVMALLIAPVAISSVYSSTSREITFDVTKLEPKQEEIFYGKLTQFFNDNSVTDGKELSIVIKTTAPSSVAINEILTAGNYEISFMQGQDHEEKVGQKVYYRGASEYAALIESLAKNDELNLRVYDKLKSLTLEDELLEEVSKFERIDKDNYKKLIQACLRTVKMNAVGRYQTIDDLVETNFVDSLCRTVGHMENVENLRNGIWFCTDIPIDDVTDEELYQKMCDRLKSLVD
ncbi:MAG: hypothetical protein IJS10_03335 [Alphaproteobacteria bacterium]|nr:hypothetical protein [Alphaproteobacteria bacterium]